MSVINNRIKDNVVDILVREILKGNIIANTELKQEELAEKLQVSRIPIREALMTLQEYGLVERRNNRHTYVVDIDAKYLKETFEFIILFTKKIINDILLSEEKEIFLSQIESLKNSKEKEIVLQFQKILEFNLSNLCILNILTKLNNSFIKYGLFFSNQNILNEKLTNIFENLKIKSKLDIAIEEYYNFILSELLIERRKLDE